MGKSTLLILNSILLICCSLILIGCPNYTKIANFTQHDLSRTKNHNITLLVVKKDSTYKNDILNGEEVTKQSGKKLADDENGEEKLSEEEIDKLKKVLLSKQALVESFESCGVEETPAKPTNEKLAAEVVILPIVAAVGKLVINNYIDDITYKAEALVKGAKKGYAVTNFMSNDDLKNVNCLMIARNSDLKKEIKGHMNYGSDYDMLVMLKKEEVGESGFYLRPLYAEIDNSVAITDVNDPTIDLTLGLSSKTFGSQQSKIPGLFSLGEAVMTIPNMSFEYDKKSKTKRFKDMNNLIKIKSEMVPYAAKGDDRISLTVSVVETGNVGFSFEQAKTELQAIKDALGPAVETSINAFAE